MSNTSTCKKCNKSVRNTTYVTCNGFCSGIYHATITCSGIIEYEKIAEYLKSKSNNSNIIFICTECKEKLKVIKTGFDSIESKFEKMDAINEKLEEKEKSLEEIINKLITIVKDNTNNKEKTSLQNNSNKKINVRNDRKTYAEMIKQDPMVVIKPKKNQSSVLTKTAVKNHISPENLAINKVAEKSGGTIAIYCKDTNSVGKIKNNVEEKLGEDYEAFIPKEIKPKILISGMSENYDKETIVNKLKNQNTWITEKELKCIRIYETKRKINKFNAIVEMCVEDYNETLKKGKIIIGWDVCRVYENFQVMRCYKCLEYGHKKDRCLEENNKCLKCGGDHLAKECKAEEERCVNCVKANKKYNLGLNERHSCIDRNCEVYRRKIEINKKRIFL